MKLTRPARAVVLIGASLLALAAGVGHALLPSRPAAPAPTTSRPAVQVKQSFYQQSRRPYGMLHMDGLDIPSPRLHPAAVDFLHVLIGRGIVVQRVDPSPWDGVFDQADADLVSTDHGNLTIISGFEAGHPLWACPAGGGAVIGGGDLPAYAISAGGDLRILQIAGPILFARSGEVLVLGYQDHLWNRLRPALEPVTCPSGQ